MINLDTRLQAALSSLSGTYLAAIVHIAEKHYGLDRDDILHSIGLSNTQLMSIESRIPTYYLFNLFRVLSKTTNDLSLGLHLGQHLEVKSFSTLGYLLANTRTIGEGIHQLLRYEKLANELCLTSFEELENDECILRWHSPIQGEEVRYIQEIILTGMVCLTRSMAASPVQLFSVNFEHSKPSNYEEYERTLKCPVNFDQNECSIRFSKSVLDTPLKDADPLLSKIVTRSAETMLLEFDSSVNFISEVRNAIFLLLPSGELSMERVAKALGISNRVIHNRLKKHDVTFNCLVDEVRRILALHYIADETVSLVDIGLLLGFADQSSFTRAFKRWQGETPGDYRKSFFVRTRRAKAQFYLARA